MSKILLDNRDYHFSEDSLPMLIHGEEHAGASLFTVTLLADLYRSGSKILFCCGYNMAQDEFIKQVGEQPTEDRVIFVHGTNPDEFLRKVQELLDINERVILIKNIDLFDQSIFDAVANKNNVVISGDIERVLYKDKILSKTYKTKIFFSRASFEQIPNLLKWHGYMIGQKDKGDVSLNLE